MADRTLSNVYQYKTVLRAAQANPGKFFNIHIREKNEVYNKGTKYYDLQALIGKAGEEPTYRKIKIGYAATEIDPPLINLMNYETEQHFEKAIGIDLNSAPLDFKKMLLVMNTELEAAKVRAANNPDPAQRLVIKKPLNLFLNTHHKADHEKEELQGKPIERLRGIFKFNWIVPKDPSKLASINSRRNRVYSVKNTKQIVCDENGKEFCLDNYKSFWKGGEKITNLILDIESMADTQKQVSVPMIITRAIVDFDARNGYAKNEGDFNIDDPESDEGTTTSATVNTLADSVNNMMNGDFEDSGSDDEIDIGSGKKI